MKKVCNGSNNYVGHFTVVSTISKVMAQKQEILTISLKL